MSTIHRFGTDETNPSLIRWPEERPRYTSLKAAVQGETARWNAVGMAAGLIHGHEAETVVAGTASIGTGFPVTGDALFLIGSISKVYAPGATVNANAPPAPLVVSSADPSSSSSRTTWPLGASGPLEVSSVPLIVPGACDWAGTAGSNGFCGGTSVEQDTAVAASARTAALRMLPSGVEILPKLADHG